MEKMTPASSIQLIFEKLNPQLLKSIFTFKSEITCRFSLQEIVDLSDLKNLNLQLKNDRIFHLQIRDKYLLQMSQKQHIKPTKLNQLDSIISGFLITPKVKFQIKRQYQSVLFALNQQLQPLPRALGLLLYLDQTKQPLDFIVEDSDQKIQGFGKILESKLAVQKNFHKIFKPLKKLGKGSSATVIQGKDLRDGQIYAIKGFKKSKGFSLQKVLYSLQKGIFFKQLQFMSQNSHHQIVKLNSVFESQNSLYMVFDKYDQNLYDFLINKGLNSQYELKAIIKGLLQALEFLHSKGIMHRDIKPENIMINHKQFEKKDMLKRKTNIVPVLIDFGFAENQQNQQFTIYRCGTPGFIAPQILKDYLIGQGAVDSFNSQVSTSKKRYGKACDIFSLGCLFHILLTNKMVFPGETKKQLIKNNMEANINLTSKDYKLLDISAKKLLFKMLQKNPDKRITAAEALKDDYFRLQMFNFKQIKFKNPFLIQNQEDKQSQQEDQDRHLLLFQ